MFRRAARKTSAATVVAATVSMLWLVPAAEAAYPASNGDIAFSSTRDGNIAIYQVNPTDPDLGTPAGDQSATSELTLGGADVEPFYSPDGKTVYFSSDRDAANEWVVYSVAQASPESSTAPATELSAFPGQEVNNDYSPSAAPDNSTVVFNRDNTSIDTLWAPAGPTSVCTLYTPPEGLAAAGSSDGSGSRVVFDPADPSELVFVGADGHIHLLSGIKFTPGSNPCNETGLTDVDLSAEAFPAGSKYATGDDAYPDWSPNGQQIVFSSTRGGGDTLFIIDLTTTTPTSYPIWSGLAAPNEAVSTQPVFSPDGTEIAFAQPRKGTQIYDEMLAKQVNGVWQGDGSATDISEQLSNGISFDSEPDWQPAGNPPVLPESPYAVALPGAALLACGSLFGLRYRRARRRATQA